MAWRKKGKSRRGIEASGRSTNFDEGTPADTKIRSAISLWVRQLGGLANEGGGKKKRGGGKKGRDLCKTRFLQEVTRMIIWLPFVGGDRERLCKQGKKEEGGGEKKDKNI